MATDQGDWLRIRGMELQYLAKRSSFYFGDSVLPRPKYPCTRVHYSKVTAFPKYTVRCDSTCFGTLVTYIMYLLLDNSAPPV